jgi:predicted NUDIX family phosphoesterase
MQENHYLVPQQQQGLKLDIEHHITAVTAEDAEYLFVDAKDRLLDINNWNKHCPEMGTELRLTDSHGLGVGRHARKGDLVRIDIPGKGPTHPGGFNWVLVEAIEYDDYPDLSMESFAVRVRTATDPLTKQNITLIPDDDTTSTFVIERRGVKLYASFHGRNGAGNNDHISANEWECLVKAFLKDNLKSER